MRILIGYDGSECADAALDDLMQAGLPANAEAHILSVAEVWLPPPPPSSYDIVNQARATGSQAELERQYARECRAAKDALALAARFVLGSVSAAVAARAHCSVEVVRTNQNLGKIEGG